MIIPLVFVVLVLMLISLSMLERRAQTNCNKKKTDYIINLVQTTSAMRIMIELMTTACVELRRGFS